MLNSFNHGFEKTSELLKTVLDGSRVYVTERCNNPLFMLIDAALVLQFNIGVIRIFLLFFGYLHPHT